MIAVVDVVFVIVSRSFAFSGYNLYFIWHIHARFLRILLGRYISSSILPIEYPHSLTNQVFVIISQ